MCDRGVQQSVEGTERDIFRSCQELRAVRQRDVDTVFLRLNNGTCQQKELASSLSQPKQTTNSAVKQLERGGYVTLKCGSDRRCRLVELTPKGSGLAVSTSDHVIAAERETWGDFTEEEQDSLIELLSKYNKRLKTRMEEKNEK